jgi:hypothetical protein
MALRRVVEWDVLYAGEIADGAQATQLSQNRLLREERKSQARLENDIGPGLRLKTAFRQQLMVSAKLAAQPGLFIA